MRKERKDSSLFFHRSTDTTLARFFPEAHPLPCLSFAGHCWRIGRQGRASSSGIF